jgi:hypothetical protein
MVTVDVEKLDSGETTETNREQTRRGERKKGVGSSHWIGQNKGAKQTRIFGFFESVKSNLIG